MSEPRVLNAILAGIGAEDDVAVSQAERIICCLERAGYRVTRAEISEVEEIKSLRARNAELRAVLCGSDPDLPRCLRPIEWLHTLLLDADKIHAALDGDDPSAVDMVLDELRTMVTKARVLLEEARETPPDLREDHAGSVVSVPSADQMSGEVRR